jgi:hypothetical protein
MGLSAFGILTPLHPVYHVRLMGHYRSSNASVERMILASLWLVMSRVFQPPYRIHFTDLVTSSVQSVGRCPLRD